MMIHTIHTIHMIHTIFFYRLALGNQRFPVRVRLLAMCRGELSAVIARLMSNCEAGGSGSEELKKCPPPSLAVL